MKRRIKFRKNNMMQTRGSGKFLGWGIDFKECENGIGQFTVAIIELDDGEVTTVAPGPGKLTFISSPENACPCKKE